MKRAHVRRRQKGRDDAEKHEGDQDSDRHSRNACSKKVPRGRCHAEPPILEHHTISETKPDINDKINIIRIHQVIGQAD